MKKALKIILVLAVIVVGVGHAEKGGVTPTKFLPGGGGIGGD